MAVLLSRLTRWPLSEVLSMPFAEACLWLEEAATVEREINGR